MCLHKHKVYACISLYVYILTNMHVLIYIYIYIYIYIIDALWKNPKVLVETERLENKRTCGDLPDYSVI